MTDYDGKEGVELEASSEKPVRLRAPIIIAVISVLAMIVVATMTLAFSPRDTQRAQEEFEKPVADVSASTNEPLNALPRDYDQIPVEQPITVAETLPVEMAVEADLEQDRRQADMEALQEKAMSSGVFFEMQNANALKTQGSEGFRPGSAQGSELGEGGADGDYASDLPEDDKQNLQGHKMAFLDSMKGADEFILDDRLHPPLSEYEVKAGTLIPAHLITAINSDLPGDVIAQVSEHVYDSVTGRFLLIPQGSKLYGRYDSVISYGQERVLVAWERLMMPNGKSIKLGGMIAADTAGMSGLEDEVDNHFMRLAGAVLLSTTLSLGGNLANDDDGDSLGGDIGDTVAQESSRVGQRFVSKSMNIQPTLKIRGGSEVRVFVNKDMILEPYKE